MEDLVWDLYIARCPKRNWNSAQCSLVLHSAHMRNPPNARQHLQWLRENSNLELRGPTAASTLAPEAPDTCT
eukprot:3081995-Alexandrium_andersonii.AAC.1